LGDAVVSGKRGETFVKHITHGMAVKSIAKEFQSKKRPHGMFPAGIILEPGNPAFSSN
jgi:hypothetical protein